MLFDVLDEKVAKVLHRTKPRLMARLEKEWHWQRRCAQQIGMRLS
jgi:hypothetical protein